MKKKITPTKLLLMQSHQSVNDFLPPNLDGTTLPPLYELFFLTVIWLVVVGFYYYGMVWADFLCKKNESTTAVSLLLVVSVTNPRFKLAVFGLHWEC